MKYIQLLRSIPKTVLFNLKAFPLREALKFPVLVHYSVRIVGKVQRNRIFLTGGGAQVKLGFPYLNYPVKPTVLKIGNSARINFEGKATIQNGCELNVEGNINFGDNFRCNTGSKIDCKKEVTFGRDVLIGAECYFSDSDGHSIYILDCEEHRINPDEMISVGNHVWFGRGVYVLKGSSIGNDSIIAARSLVTRDFSNANNVIIAGGPSKIIKINVQWQQ